MFAYVKNLESSKRSIVEASVIYDIRQVTVGKGEKKRQVWKRTLITPKDEEDFLRKHDYGIVVGSSVVRHYIIVMAESEQDLKMKIRTTRPPDPNRMSHGPASIPLSDFTTDEERNKLKQDKREKTSTVAHTKKAVNDGVVEQFKKITSGVVPSEKNTGNFTSGCDNKKTLPVPSTSTPKKPSSGEDHQKKVCSEEENEKGDKAAEKKVDYVFKGTGKLFEEKKHSTKSIPSSKGSDTDKSKATPSKKEKETCNSKYCSDKMKKLKQQLDLTLQEAECHRVENSTLKMTIEKYFKSMSSKLDCLSAASSVTNDLQSLTHAVEVEEEYKADVELSIDDVYCGEKQIVSRKALLRIEDDFDSFTKRAVAVAELVLGKTLTLFSCTGESKDGKVLLPIENVHKKAVRVILKRMGPLYDAKGQLISINKKIVDNFFKKQPTEERRKQEIKQGTYKPAPRIKKIKGSNPAPGQSKKEKETRKKTTPTIVVTDSESDFESISNKKNIKKDTDKLAPEKKGKEETKKRSQFSTDSESDGCEKRCKKPLKKIKKEDMSLSSDSEEEASHKKIQKDDKFLSSDSEGDAIVITDEEKNTEKLEDDIVVNNCNDLDTSLSMFLSTDD